MKRSFTVAALGPDADGPRSSHAKRARTCAPPSLKRARPAEDEEDAVSAPKRIRLQTPDRRRRRRDDAALGADEDEAARPRKRARRTTADEFVEDWYAFWRALLAEANRLRQLRRPPVPPVDNPVGTVIPVN